MRTTTNGQPKLTIDGKADAALLVDDTTQPPTLPSAWSAGSWQRKVPFEHMQIQCPQMAYRGAICGHKPVDADAGLDTCLESNPRCRHKLTHNKR